MDTAELVIDPCAELAECPWWDVATRTLVFVDIVNGRVHRWDPVSRSREVTDVGETVGAVVPRARGGLVLVLKDRLAVRGTDGRLDTVCLVAHGQPDGRLNDAKCDPAGRLFVGSMVGVASPGLGALYRVDGELSARQVIAGTTISNGMGWSLDGTTMYFIDTPTGTVDAFDYDQGTGRLGAGRPLVRFGPGDGYPDGMTVDSEDHLWVASFGGGFVRRFAPDGTPVDTIELPVTEVTSCAFGGPDLDELFITTARVDLTRAQLAAQPYAGGVFRARPGVRGRLDNAFAW